MSRIYKGNGHGPGARAACGERSTLPRRQPLSAETLVVFGQNLISGKRSDSLFIARGMRSDFSSMAEGRWPRMEPRFHASGETAFHNESAEASGSLASAVHLATVLGANYECSRYSRHIFWNIMKQMKLRRMLLQSSSGPLNLSREGCNE
jgi:hypothetical protein